MGNRGDCRECVGVEVPVHRPTPGNLKEEELGKGGIAKWWASESYRMLALLDGLISFAAVATSFWIKLFRFLTFHLRFEIELTRT